MLCNKLTHLIPADTALAAAVQDAAGLLFQYRIQLTGQKFHICRADKFISGQNDFLAMCKTVASLLDDIALYRQFPLRFD